MVTSVTLIVADFAKKAIKYADFVKISHNLPYLFMF